jgi:hypothetical protein
VFQSLCRSYIFHGVDRTPAFSPALNEDLSVQNIRICCRFVGTGFCSCDRRQYSGSLLRNLGLTSLQIKGWGVPIIGLRRSQDRLFKPLYEF